jgi:hypothetical protein
VVGHALSIITCAGSSVPARLPDDARRAYEAAGVVSHIEVPFYPADWNLHRGADRYLDGVMRHAIEISGPPLPGDVAVFRFGCCYAHGAIVVEWPRIIHARVAVGVIYGDAAQPKLGSHKPCFLDPFVNIFVEPK